MSARSELAGYRELQRQFKALGKVPQKVVTKAARRGAAISQKDAKQNAPVDTGNLRRGIKMIGEKSKRRGKKVFQIVFDRAYNNIFQKRNAQGEIVAYYPVSQEYGFFTKDGRYIPGYRFMRNSIENNQRAIRKEITSVMMNELEKFR